MARGLNMENTLERTAILYRYFSADGALLYIGMTERWADRAAQHESKPWVKLAASVTMEQFPDRISLAEAERAAIMAEKPIFNVTHNKGQHGPRRTKRSKTRTIASPCVFRALFPDVSNLDQETVLRLSDTLQWLQYCADMAHGTERICNKTEWESAEIGVQRFTESAPQVAAALGIPIEKLYRAAQLETPSVLAR